MGIILRPKSSESFKISPYKANSFLEALPNAINEAVKLLLFMLGSITFFMFLAKLISSFFNLNPFITTIITGLLDLTSGISLVGNLSLDLTIKGLIILSFITFGSLSVHIQVLNNIKEQDISYKYFLMGRIIQTALALLLYLIF